MKKTEKEIIETAIHLCNTVTEEQVIEMSHTLEERTSPQVAMTFSVAFLDPAMAVFSHQDKKE
jgi:hypothetical protein